MALVQYGETNLEGAEKWLKEMAVKEGWAKAVKLSDRETGQGVCAVLSEYNVAAVLEVNCETDFVAKNEEFQSLVAYVANSVLKASKVAAGNTSSCCRVVSVEKLFLFTTFRYIPAPLLRRLSAAVEDTASAQQSISKEALIKLCTRTGYSFVNCRMALVQYGEINLKGAEKWLKEVAVKEGWTKAVKLSDRETGQGVCAVLSEYNVAAVLEVNCETDFVAKNEEFQSLVIISLS